MRLNNIFDENSKMAWDNMVNWAETYWTGSESQKLLETTLKNHTDIAKVTYARLGNASQKWVHRKIPALDNLSPTDCLETTDLIKRLKEALLRMHL